jgi:hypothetical protein
MTTATTRRPAVPEEPDEGYLVRLESHVGRRVLDELLAEGAEALVERAADLERLAAAPEAGRVRALAHDLVALAGHLGLAALSARAEALERTALAGGGSLGAETAAVARAAWSGADALGAFRVRLGAARVAVAAE